MISIKEIEEKTMTAKKKASAKNDLFAYYIGRKLSYVLTIPFLYMDIKPNTVSLISIIPLIIGFITMCISTKIQYLYIAWLLFFLWNLLDGVDGNIARYKKLYSNLGSVYDAMSGYVAMVLSFFGIGVVASHFPGLLNEYINLSSESYIILGALSGIFVIFPKLIMHKTISTLGDKQRMENLTRWSNFGLIKIIVLNLSSAAGMVQALMLLAIIFRMSDLFTICYFIFNGVVMVAAIYSVFKIGSK